VLTLTFIGVQTVLANRKGGQQAARESQTPAARRRRLALYGVGAAAVLVILALIFIPRTTPSQVESTAVGGLCNVAPFREAEAAQLVQDGAVIVYHRTAGPECVDELYAIYPDGRVTGTSGTATMEKQAAAEDIQRLLTAISVDHEWFTSEIYSTYLTPCRQCYAHYIDISYDGQQKAVTGVDGTTAMPPGYAFALAEIRPFLPELKPAP